MAAPFNLAAVDTALRGTPFHNQLHHLASTPSTQTLALQAARAGVRHGVWIADEQTAGRGRGSHSWHSPAGAGLLVSILLPPPLPPSTNHLSLVVALACQAAIAELTPFQPLTHVDIRWPNDLLLRGPHSAAFRKVGGILIESATTPAPLGKPRFTVVGIGLNVNHTELPPDLDSIATSLRRELSQPAPPLAREPLLAALLRHLHRELADPIPRDLTRHSSWIRGKRVHVAPELPGQPTLAGTTDGLTPEGFLRILAHDGSTHIVRSGGVREAPASGSPLTGAVVS